MTDEEDSRPVPAQWQVTEEAANAGDGLAPVIVVAGIAVLCRQAGELAAQADVAYPGPLPERCSAAG
jgi:hypothetical protein